MSAHLMGLKTGDTVVVQDPEGVTAEGVINLVEEERLRVVTSAGIGVKFNRASGRSVPTGGWFIVEPASTAVDHPAHYNQHPSGVECIDVVEHMSFNVGNAIKYLWRAGHKGPPLQDIEKAVWYLNREVARLGGKS